MLVSSSASSSAAARSIVACSAETSSFASWRVRQTWAIARSAAMFEKSMSSTRCQVSSASSSRFRRSANSRARCVRMTDALLVGLRDVEVPLEHVGELRPLALLIVELGERTERLAVLAAQIEHALPAVDGGLEVAQTVRGRGAPSWRGSPPPGRRPAALSSSRSYTFCSSCQVLVLPRRRGRGPTSASSLVGASSVEDHAVRSAPRSAPGPAAPRRPDRAACNSSTFSSASVATTARCSSTLDELRPLLERAVDAIEVRQGVALRSAPRVST